MTNLNLVKRISYKMVSCVSVFYCQCDRTKDTTSKRRPMKQREFLPTQTTAKDPQKYAPKKPSRSSLPEAMETYSEDTIFQTERNGIVLRANNNGK